MPLCWDGEKQENTSREQLKGFFVSRKMNWPSKHFDGFICRWSKGLLNNWWGEKKHISWQSCKKVFMCGEKCKQTNTNKSSLCSSIRFSTFLTASNTEKPLWKARSWRNSILPASTMGRFCKWLQSPLLIWSLTLLSLRSSVRPALPLQLLLLEYQQRLRAEPSPSHISPIPYVTLISHQISTAPTGIKPEALQMLWHFYGEAAISRILHKIWVNCSLCDEYFPCYFKAVQQTPTPALGSLDDSLNREKMHLEKMTF